MQLTVGQLLQIRCGRECSCQGEVIDADHGNLIASQYAGDSLFTQVMVMLKNKVLPLFIFAGLLGAVPAAAQAHDQGDWLLRFGITYVEPKSNNSELVSVDGAASFTPNIAYMLTQNWSLELLAAWPFEHDIDLVGGPRVASTKHLPPTFTVNYHFLPGAGFQPYVGAGFNYTLFFDEKTVGPLAGTDLDLDSSWGLSAQVGADINLGEKWLLNLNVRWIDIDTDAKLDGAPLGTVEIDPVVYSANLGFRF